MKVKLIPSNMPRVIITSIFDASLHHLRVSVRRLCADPIGDFGVRGKGPNVTKGEWLKKGGEGVRPQDGLRNTTIGDFGVRGKGPNVTIVGWLEKGGGEVRPKENRANGDFGVKGKGPNVTKGGWRENGERGKTPKRHSKRLPWR